MSIKRIHPGMGVGQDSCVSGRFPASEQDFQNGTQGVYLGRNPAALGEGLFLTYWEADEVAQAIGFPHIEVYEAQKRLLDEQAQTIADLVQKLDKEVHDLQLKAVTTEFKNAKKEILGEIEGLTAAIRARLGDGGSKPYFAQGAAKPAGAAKAK